MKNKFHFTPDWIAGFTQSDGSFTVSFEKRSKGMLYRPSPIFSLSQTNLELDMFIKLQEYLGVGKVYKNREGVIFVVKKIEELVSVVLPLFDKSKLIGGKLDSYIKFREVVLLMKDKKHLTLEGLLQIIEIAYFMNEYTTLRNNSAKFKILSEIRKKYGNLPAGGSHQEPIILSKVSGRYKIRQDHLPLNKEFVRGLVDGDGSFNIAFRSDSKKIGLNFTVVQENSSISVLHELISFFNCGNVYKLPSEASRYQVQSKEELINKVLPIFKEMSLNTRKQQNLDKFIKVCNILNLSWYKEDESLLKIVEIAWDMNIGNRKLTKEEYILKFFPNK